MTFASNDYQMSISIGSWNREFDKGSLFYCQECEFGGILDGKKVDTSKNSITFKGEDDAIAKGIFAFCNCSNKGQIPSIGLRLWSTIYF